MQAGAHVEVPFPGGAVPGQLESFILEDEKMSTERKWSDRACQLQGLWLQN